MYTLNEHPSVVKFFEKNNSDIKQVQNTKLKAEWLRGICLEAGADDAGFVEIDRKEIADQQDDILAEIPNTKSILILAFRMNRQNIRTLARSIASNEFIETGKHLKEVLRKVVSTLEKKGIWVVSESGLFPMEIDRLPAKGWVASLKPLAVSAGLGRMGRHRMIIHPKFGAFMYLAAVFIDREIEDYNRPIDCNPCIKCRLCTAACPTGAIASDGQFDLQSCVTHNYREKIGGFSDWVENIVKSKNVADYRKRVSDSETISIWQSLGYEANTKCNYCMAVCPAGDDVIGPFLSDRKGFLDNVVKPLQKKEENVYVVPGSDAEAYASHRFPHKTIKQVGNGLRAPSIKSFLSVLPRIFQRGQSEGLNAIYHFTFTGEEEAKATINIKDRKINVIKGHIGKSAIHVTADSKTWLKFLAKERNIVWALLTRKIRIKGSPKLLLAFGKCFPS